MFKKILNLLKKEKSVEFELFLEIIRKDIEENPNTEKKLIITRRV